MSNVYCLFSHRNPVVLGVYIYLLHYLHKKGIVIVNVEVQHCNYNLCIIFWLNIQKIYVFTTWHDMCEHELSTLMQKWSVVTSHLHTQHVVLLLCPFTIWHMSNMGKYHTCYSYLFHFPLDNVDSASDAAFASISSSISSNWNNSLWIFFTSPICCVSEFRSPMCGQEWGTVFFCKLVGLWRCVGRNMNWWQYSKFCFLKSTFLYNFLV